MAIFTLGNACSWSTLGNFNSTWFTFGNVVCQPIQKNNTLYKILFNQIIISLRSGGFEANNVSFFAGIDDPGESFDQIIAFEDQVTFFFFGFFRESYHNQIVFAVGHCNARDIVESQPVFDFTIFGVQQVDGRLC